MTGTVASLIDAFAGLRVLVVGDALLDLDIEGTSDRLCREARVPVVTVSQRVRIPPYIQDQSVTGISQRIRSLPESTSEDEATVMHADAELLV